MKFRVLFVAVTLGTAAGCTGTSHAPQQSAPSHTSVPRTGAISASPIVSRGGALNKCPNPTGLHPFTKSVRNAAVATALAYGHVSLSKDLANSDPSWWSSVRRTWASKHRLSNRRVTALSAAPATRDAYEIIVARSCGSSLVKRSTAVTVGPPENGSGPHCNACHATYFLVNRLGQPLVYFVN